MKTISTFLKKNSWLLVLFIPIVIFFWWQSHSILILAFGSGVNSINFGDKFEAISALFSGLAFSLLIITLYIQRSELELQREELKSTREELEGQKQQMMEQNKTISKQRFENTFFNLLEYLLKIINRDSTPGSHTPTSYIEKSFNNIHVKYKTAIKRVNENPFSYMIGFDFQTLRLFFNNINAIILYIDKSDIKEKTFYINILREQLKDRERLLYLYYCLSNFSKNGEIRIVEKYPFFEDIDVRLYPAEFWMSPSPLHEFKKEAFGGEYPKLT